MKNVLILIPAYNEEEVLEKNIIKLHDFLEENIRSYDCRILISDNDSIDKTLKISEGLAKKYKKVYVRHLNRRPMSYSIKKNFLLEDADIYIHMDADLSTDIKHIPELIKGIEEEYDIVTGSRTSKESKTSRNFHRHLISLFLIFLLRTVFFIKLSDFQCGFKAINRRVRDNIIPKMKAVNVGFMSTEMLVVANKKGYKIKEIPVIWKDTRKSKSPIFKGILDALLNIIK